MRQGYFKLVALLKKIHLNQEMTRFVLEKPWDFKAGQYTLVSGHYFSIASSPLCPYLELDIQNSPAHPLDPTFAKLLNHAKTLDLSPPAGEAFLHPNDRPLILIAGGSGIAPMKSIAETAAGQRPIHLYWGVRHRACFYDLGSIDYIPILSEETAPGFRHGLVHEAVLQDFQDLSGFDIYLAGPFPMSYAAREAFVKHGAKREAIFSDAFEFE